jgi:hypothetical protein
MDLVVQLHVNFVVWISHYFFSSESLKTIEILFVPSKV